MSLLQFPWGRISPKLVPVLWHLTNLEMLSLRKRFYSSVPGELSSDIVESLFGCLSLRTLDLSDTNSSIKVVSISKEHIHRLSLLQPEMKQSKAADLSKQLALDSVKQALMYAGPYVRFTATLKSADCE